MNNVLVIIVVITVILVGLAGFEVVQGNHFSVEALVGHFAEFPTLTLPDGTVESALDFALDMLLYGFRVIEWGVTFDPWVEGAPAYRDNEFPWNGGVTTV